MKAAKYSAWLILLSLLFSARVAFAVAQVESRSASSWNEGRQTPRLAENFVQPEVAAASLETQSKLEFLQQEVQELRGKVEEQAYQLQQMQENHRKLFVDLEKRLHDKPVAAAKPNHADISDTESTMQNSSEKLPVSPASPFVEANEQDILAQEKIYQNAYHLIQNKDYDAALVGFKALMTQFPNGKYLPNAHYWIGEIYLAKGNLSGAAMSFETVIRQFPEHPKAPDSLLKLGYVEYTKGEWKRSKELLSQVKSQYPGSTSAQLADSRLQMMHREKRS